MRAGGGRICLIGINVSHINLFLWKITCISVPNCSTVQTAIIKIHCSKTEVNNQNGVKWVLNCTTGHATAAHLGVAAFASGGNTTFLRTFWQFLTFWWSKSQKLKISEKLFVYHPVACAVRHNCWHNLSIFKF